MNENYPRFLSHKPDGEDLFDGQSHAKVAEILKDTIENNLFENHVIGIEGEWGSGKSNTIGILQKKFEKDKKKVFFFTFDAWGHQEDLTRRSFLEELISELLEKKLLINKENKWATIESELLAKKSTKHTKKFPLIKRYWILISLSILSYALCNVIYEDFFQTIDNIRFTDYYFGYTEKLIIKYLLPFVLFLLGICDVVREYNRITPETIGLENIDQLTFWRRIEFLAYWFNGKDLTSKEVENIIDLEPSVKQFKTYFNKIVEDLDTTKVDQVVLIFDNMDRIATNQKLFSLWSAIHTFFAECTYKKVWILIPYDRTHLANYFDRDTPEKGKNIAKEFINKTFSTSFRISPPVVSDWKIFFGKKLKQAFGETYFEEKNIESEKYFIETIFDYSYPAVINPRQVISYVNSLVSYVKQWDDKIPLRYLALFTIKGQEIIERPLEKISNRSYLGNLGSLFLEDNDLEKNMAALVFNVDLDKANEVLLKREMEQIFINGDLKKLDAVKSHPAFLSYFDKVFKEVINSNTKILDKIGSVLYTSKDAFALNVYNTYWNRVNDELYKEVLNKNIYHNEFLDIHKLSLQESKKASGKPKEIIKTLIKNVSEKFVTNEKVNFQYYEFIKEIESFLIEKDISFKIKEVLSIHIIEPSTLISIIKIEHDNFDNYKLITLKDALNEYLTENELGITPLDNGNGRTVLESLVKIKGHEHFKLLAEYITTENDTIKFNENEKVRNIVLANRILTKDGNKPITKLIKFETIRDHFINYTTIIEEDYFNDAVCILIAYHDEKKVAIEPYLKVLRNEEKLYDPQEFAKIIEYYITYGDLLKLRIAIGDRYSLIQDIIMSLTKEPQGMSTIGIKWVFENYNNIVDTIFDDDPGIFLERFDGWKNGFSKHINKENTFEAIEESFFYHIIDEENQPYDSIQLALSLAIENFEVFSEANWAELFDSNTKIENVFKHIYANGQMPSTITKGSEFMHAFEKHMYEIIKGNITGYDKGFWKDLIAKESINVNSLKRIFNNILDQLLHHDHSIAKEELLFFGDGIIKYATNLTKYAADVQRLILIPFLQIDVVVDEFVKPNLESIIEVLNASDENLHDVKEVVKSKLENTEDQHYAVFQEISYRTKIKGLIEYDKKNSEDQTK